jgi:hypothetical protein
VRETSSHPQHPALNPDKMLTINLWLYSVVMKLVPCLVLGLFTALLVRTMYRAEERAAALTTGKRPEGRRSSTVRRERTDRTTRLLITLLVLFLLAETPMVRPGRPHSSQGILGLLSAIYKKKFWEECYIPLGEIMDMLALLNCATNFLLYSLMSTQFRETLCTILRKKEQPSRKITMSTELALMSTEV